MAGCHRGASWLGTGVKGARSQVAAKLGSFKRGAALLAASPPRHQPASPFAFAADLVVWPSLIVLALPSPRSWARAARPAWGKALGLPSARAVGMEKHLEMHLPDEDD